MGHPHASNHPPADFAIDCNTLHSSKGATGCDVMPIEFLSSCVQLVYSNWGNQSWSSQ